MKKIAIAALLSAFVAAPAIAADSYIGASAGQNKIDVSGVKTSTAYSLFGGYSFSEFFAGELAYVDFGSADRDAGGSVKGYAVSLDAVGSLPLGRDYALFAKLGLAETKVEPGVGGSQTKDDWTYGLGAQYNANRNVGVRLGYDNYRVGSDTRDSALWSLGVLFKF